MANPFGDEPVNGGSASGNPNPFGDEVVQPRGYLGASAVAGAHTAAGIFPTVTGGILSTLGIVNNDMEAVELAKNDPEEYKRWLNSQGGMFSRFSQQSNQSADMAMKNLTPEAKALAEKEYFTLDPNKAAYLSPTRVAGDALRSIPSMAAMVGSFIATRGAARTAQAEAAAQGLTSELARAAAMKAGAETMAKTSAISEGAIGAVQAHDDVRGQAGDVPQAQLEQSPVYQDLIRRGYTPEMARLQAANLAADQAGLGAGVVDAATNAVGGQVLGKLVGEGGTLAKRTAKGFATESATETVQSAGEQLTQNQAVKANMNPFQDELAGVGEAAVGGGVVGGVMGGVFGAAARPQVTPQAKADALNAAASAQLFKGVTGNTPAEQETIDVITKAATKPRLTPLQSKIVMQAAALGLDPADALAVVQIESKFKPDAKNPQSTAHGLFQMLDSTWQEVGGGDRADINTQITNGLANLANTKHEMEKQLGHKLGKDELYFGQLFGPTGGVAVITAAHQDPQGSFLETVQKYDPKNAKAIVNNNGLAGLTNEQAANKIYGMMGRATRELGGDASANTQMNAGKPVDAIADVIGSAKIADEIDALTAELEMKAPTPEDKAAAAAETEVAPTPEGEALAVALDGEQQVEPGTVREVGPTLPAELATATPTVSLYKGGTTNKPTQTLQVRFAADIDRAAYALATAPKDSERHTTFLDWLIKNTGMDAPSIAQYAREVESKIRAIARSKTWADGESIIFEDKNTRADSGTTTAERFTRENADNPNDHVPLVDLPIIDGEGSLRNVPLEPGVTAVGVDSRTAPINYMRAARDTLAEIINRFAPGARVVLSFKTADAKGTISSYSTPPGVGKSKRVGKIVPGLYHINMRNATGLGVGQDSSRNTSTQAKILYAAYHEAGHVVADHMMTEGMSPEMLRKFRATGEEALAVYFTEEELATLPPDRAAVLREYNALKLEVLNNPAFTVEMFMDEWLSPWKLGHGWGPKQGKLSFLKNFFGESGLKELGMPAETFALMMHREKGNDILSPHEYMAEQMSRYAYAKGLDVQSPLAQQFFQSTIAALRQFFQMLKRGGNIRSGVAFAEWLDSMTATTQNFPEVIKNDAVPAEIPEVTVPAEKAPKVKKAAAPKKPAPLAKPRVKPKKAKPTEGDKVVAGARANADAIPFSFAPRVAGEAAVAEEVTPEVVVEAPKTTLETIMEIAPDYTAEQLSMYGRILRSDPLMKELKQDAPERYAYYMNLLKAGRMDELRYELQQDVSEDLADKIRFDTDNAEHMTWREMELKVLGVLPRKGGIRTWLGNGLRMLSDAKDGAITLRQKAFAYPEVAGLQALEMLMNMYKSFKARLELAGLEATDGWSKLSKEQNGRLEQALREEHYNGEHLAEIQIVNGVYRFVPTAALMDYAAKHKLDEQTVNVWLMTKNAHIQHMNLLQKVMAEKIEQRYATRPKTRMLKKQELHQMFQDIRSRPFLPQTRFGQYALHVEESTVDGPKVVHVEFFETAGARNETMTKFKALNRDVTVTAVDYSMASSILRVLPTQLLTTVAQEFQLDPKEKADLRQLMDVVTRNVTTRKYSAQLARITGANKSLMRGFADFMWHNSNSIAKLAYRSKMMDSLQMIADDQHAARYAQDVEWLDELSRIGRFMKRYVDHMMSPADEWHKVRAFVVVKMLWGQIRSAMANAISLYQVWNLATRYQGMVGGTVETNRALLKSVSEGVSSAMQKVMRQPVEGAQVFSQEQRQMLDWAKADGIIEESYASQLATFANQGTLGRLTSNDTADKWVRNAIWAGMLPFHAVETTVRRTQLLVQFDIYRKAGKSIDQAYELAKKDTYLFQGDNTILNRPRFMRGKAAAFTIFYGYMQNQLYLFSGAQEKARNFRAAIDEGKIPDELSKAQARAQFYKVGPGGETMKMWMTMLMLGGLMGLPGAEDLDNVLELVSKKMFGSRFSLKEHAFKVASYIADNAAQFGVNIEPRSIVHGGMSNINFFGMAPAIDMSGSMSLGNAVPGFGKIDRLGEKGGFGDVLAGLAGPLGGTVKEMSEVFSDDPSFAKKLGLFLPNAIKNNLMKTYDEYQHGVLFPSGGKVTTDLKTGEVRDLTTGETLARLMGFQPTIISANKELHWMQQESAAYWMTRRNVLVQQMWEAARQGDREAEADVRDAIEKFNAGAPPGMGLRGSDLARSIRSRAKNAAKDEAGISKSRKAQFLYDDVEESFRSPGFGED